MPRLFTETERREMLAEIATVALAVGRDLYPEQGLADGDVLSIGEAAASTEGPCPRERLGYLSAVWPRLAEALRRIEAEPPLGLTTDTHLVSTVRARRVSPKDLLSSLRSGDFVPAPVTSAPLAAHLGGRLPRRVAERIVTPTADTPPNRMVKAILARFSRDLAAIAELAGVLGVSDVVTEALRLRHTVRTALRRSPWRNLPIVVGAPVPPLPPSVRTHGAYRLVYDTYRRYREGFAFDWTNPLFTLPPREAWLLYEYWCLFRIAAALREAGFRAVSSDTFAISRAGLTFSIVRGRAARLVFHRDRQTVTLYYNREFSARLDRSGWRSRSHAMRPDYVLESRGKLLVLDAKFRAYSEVRTAEEEITIREEDPANLPFVNDLNQMHAYRDGILHGDARAVTAAWLLYAGRPDGRNLPIIAYPPATPEHPFGDGEFGALLLRPFHNESLFRAILRDFIP